jgi:hypothetical protein
MMPRLSSTYARIALKIAAARDNGDDAPLPPPIDACRCRFPLLSRRYLTRALCAICGLLRPPR